MRFSLRPLFAGAVLLSILASGVQAQLPTIINGNAIAFHSTGSASGPSSWTIDRDGYVGTFIHLDNPGDVTVAVQAEGSPDGGVDPNMNIVIADTKTGFDVTPGANNYTHTYSLPAGDFFVRTELNNDLAVTPRQLQIDNISITGAVVNNFTNNTSNQAVNNAYALAASDTYIANYRKGPAKIGLSGLAPGTPVQVSMKRIAFNFGDAVPGGNSSQINSYLGNSSTTQQTNFQSKLNQNFNAITEENAGKWGNNETTQNMPSLAGVDTILNYGQAHNMNVRMHNLLWGDNASNGQQPSWVLNSNGTSGLLDIASSGGAGAAAAAATLRSAISSRIAYYVGDGPGANNLDRSPKYVDLDVYNESYHTGESPGSLTHNYWTAYGVDGVAGIYNEVKHAVAISGASTKLYVNEYSVLGDSTAYMHHIDELRQAGITDGYGEIIGGIGTQYYPDTFGAHVPTNVFASLQNYAIQGLPQTLTEFGVNSAVSTTQAAQILGEMMRLEFGSPNGAGLFMWGFQSENGGGNLYKSGAALYTLNTSNWNNWTITPAGQMWQSLLGITNPNSGWNTQLTTNVGADGTINFDGYYGDYQLTINGHAYNLSLTKGGAQYSLVIAAGDYNADGVVDAADYTVWRDTYGSSTDLRADGNGDGVVNDADYTKWVGTFGTSYPGSGSAAAVPEPGGGILALSAGLGLILFARKSRVFKGGMA
jgi:GH35 family endo-1,4-beta-xylanase